MLCSDESTAELVHGKNLLLLDRDNGRSHSAQAATAWFHTHVNVTDWPADLS